MIGRRFTWWAAVALVPGQMSVVSAHSFWLQPERFVVRAAGESAMSLLVGHGADRQRSRISRGRIIRFAMVEPSGRQVDLREELDLGGADADAHIALSEPGTHIIVLETDDRAESHLPATRFNRHLEIEGLTPAIDHRRRTGQTSADGSENYGRRAKALVHVGPSSHASAAYVTRPLGLTLEIVPEIDPYALPRSTELPLRVLYKGRPLAGALVKLTRLEDDATTFDARRTDIDGRTSFAMPRAGTWLLSVTWSESLPLTRTTQFETIFSSLSFGLTPQ